MKVFLLILLSFLSCFDAGGASLKSVPILEGKFLGEKATHQINFNGKWSVVVFLQTSCPCSQSHQGHLAELAAANPEVEFLGVHTDGYTSSEEAQHYFQVQKMPFKIIDDHNFKWARTFQAMKTPQTFLISPAAKIEYVGAISDSASFDRAQRFYLKELLTVIKEGRELPYQEQKALGCYITFERRE